MEKLFTYARSKKTAVNAAICPHCFSPYINRTRRETTYDRLMSLLYVYPFSCQLCGHSFTLFQPGVRYVRIDEDQREHQRMRVDLEAILYRGAKTYNASVIDLSIRGCTAKATDRFAVGDIVKFELKIPDDRKMLTVEAAIVRNASHERVGLEFLRFEDKQRQRLRFFMQTLLARHYH